MKIRFAAALVVLASLVSSARFAQAAPFVNLDFEQASVPPGTGQTIDASLAFPGWTARLGSDILTQVYYDYQGEDNGLVALYDRSDPSALVPLLQGQYDAYLRTQAFTLAPASLAQIGDIPSGSKSIRILVEGFRESPDITLGNVPIPMTRVAGRGILQETDVYAGDISSFAGTTTELRIFSTTAAPGVGSNVIDDITFSPLEVPEPAQFVFSIILTFCFALRRSRVRTREI
jgi:hypothetical protein